MAEALKGCAAVLLVALSITAIFAAPIWLVFCFINLEWVNPFAFEVGRAALGFGFLFASVLVAGSVLDATDD